MTFTIEISLFIKPAPLLDAAEQAAYVAQLSGEPPRFFDSRIFD